MSYSTNTLPPQQLPMSKKTKAWRKQHLDWADSKSFFNYSPVRNTVTQKKINYDLFNGILHMDDLEAVINPEGIREKFSSEQLQHFPIINSKLQVLRGEELKRVFDFRVTVTNPNSISDIERTKRDMVFQELQKLVQDQSQNEEEFNAKLAELGDYFTYEYQDMREIRANNLLNHYYKEYNMPLIFNLGFMDSIIVGEEIYQCDIKGGEPVIERLNPLKVRVFRSGYSNKIEDADVIVLEDYWSPAQIIDTYYDSLSKKDIEYLEKANSSNAVTDDMGNFDYTKGLVYAPLINPKSVYHNSEGDPFYFDPLSVFSDHSESNTPFDVNGNVKVLRVYWKSRRRIKKVKSYNPMTGEETFNFYKEDYVINKSLGEEEEIYYINEAWEGTKIGEDIYINMRPRVIQYNRLSNPSRCHFGIVGSIYNINDSKPFSLVDMMKPFSYLYDVIHDRLNKTIAKNWGKLIQLDLAKVPKTWDIDKWLYFARKSNIVVTDSFKEGDRGAAMGKIAGALNNASTGVIDAELGNSIQMYISLLEYIKTEMSEIVGITKQREGQISARETVGGIERSNMQSSHITEWLFNMHEDVKRRVLECFLETAKIALKGRSLKFSYILADGAQRLAEIDGDEFSENDYGLIVDASSNTQLLNSKLEALAQAGIQSQVISFSTAMRLFNSTSIAEKQRLIEKNEKELQERQAQMQEMSMKAEQEKAQAEIQKEQMRFEHEDGLNKRDNDTKLLIATLQNRIKEQEVALKKEEIEQDDGIDESNIDRAKLNEEIRQFNAELDLKREELKLEAQKMKMEKQMNDDDNETQIKVAQMRPQHFNNE